MFEILGIFFFGRHVGRVMRAKGRNPVPLQFATAGLWLLGEFLGAAIGMIVFTEPMPPYGFDPLAYAVAVVGGVAGGIAAVKIAESRAAKE